MTISLTCACGVLLEVDETFAGQTISCPDCQRSLAVPAPGQAPLRTSGLAIASLVLALAAAFTVLGTLLAVVLGGLALLTINRGRDRLTGKGFALAGLVLGLVLTGLSLFAYSRVELFGLDALLREPQWAGKLDYDGPLEVVRSSDGFAITRPSRDWGVLRTRAEGPIVGLDLSSRLLLLVHVRKGAYIACVPITVPDTWTLEECRNRAEQEFGRIDLASGNTRRRTLTARLEVRGNKALPDRGDVEGLELTVAKRSGRQEKTYLLRVIRRKNADVMYLVAGGTRSDHFGGLEEELRQALDTFHLLDRDRPKDWQVNW